MTAAAVLCLALALLAAMFAGLAPGPLFVVAVSGALAAIGLAVAALTPARAPDDAPGEVVATLDVGRITAGVLRPELVIAHEPAAELLTHDDDSVTGPLPVLNGRHRADRP